MNVVIVVMSVKVSFSIIVVLTSNVIIHLVIHIIIVLQVQQGVNEFLFI